VPRKEKENSTAKTGLENPIKPEGLSVNKEGNLETLEQWANRHGFSRYLKEGNTAFITMLRSAFS
jgi:hypothetical protein